MLKTIVKTQMALNKLRSDIKGASLIEYSLLVGLISIAVIVLITAISGNLSTIWTNTDTAVSGAAAAGTP